MRKEFIILAAIIVAASAYLYTRNTDQTHYELPPIESVSANDITKIDIKGPENDIQLSKKGGKWTVGEAAYPADEEKVEKMLETISGLTLTALVSEAENYDRYDLHDKAGITVTAHAGETLKRQLEVGKAAGTFRHTFVKLADDPRVFHARDNFRARFEETLDGLRDKVVLSFPKDQIMEISFTKEKETTVITKADTQPAAEGETKTDDSGAEAGTPQTAWKKADGAAVETKNINSLLGTLSSLDCNTYLYDRKKADLVDPVYIFQAKGSEAEYTLSIFEKGDEESDYPAISSHSDSAFMLSGWEVDEMLDKLGAKPEEPAENAEPAPKDDSST